MNELLAEILTGLLLIILMHIILTELEAKTWFRILVLISMSIVEISLTTKYLMELFTQKIMVMIYKITQAALDFPIIEDTLQTIRERNEIALSKIEPVLEILNRQLQWVHDNYSTFAHVRYNGGDKSKGDKLIEIELFTVHKSDAVTI